MIAKVFSMIDNAGIKSGEKILCAVSGGIDSTVMLNVMNDFGFDCIVAHCNFKLRGEESDGDQMFVKALAEKFEFKFLCETFDTHAYADETGLSVQMAARDLRYQWFYEMADQYNCRFIALAHNSDDQAETVITNLIRGTGIRGLTGMKFVKDRLFRPLIEISRKEIEEFATANSIDYRTDSTNITTKYSRNKIRHQVLPLMQEINSSAVKNILKSVKYLHDTELILKEYVSEMRLKCLYYEDDKTVIDLKELNKSAAPETVLFEILIREGFPKTLAAESLNLIGAQSGKSVSFLNVEVLKDRNRLIIEKNKLEEVALNVLISESELDVLLKYGIKASVADFIIKDFKISKNANFAYADYEKLKFPLLLRHRRDGDKFKPFGMKNFRKLSDFFTDEKLSIFEKDEALILESGQDIVWIAGHRSDDRFRITAKTKRILVLEKLA